MPTPAEQRMRERIRRRRELMFAAAAFVLVLILTTVQLNQFRAGDAMFVVMFNVNFVLLLGILLVVLRNGYKLLVERKRKVLGSRLRVRLVLFFVLFALFPCLLMLVVTTKYVQLSIDFWFKDQIETSMETAQDLTSIMFEKTGQALVRQSQNILDEVDKRNLPFGGPDMDALIERKRREYSSALIGLYADGQQRNWHGEDGTEQAWRLARDALNWEQVNNQGFGYTLVSVPFGQDYVVSVLPVDKATKGYMAQAFSLGEGFHAGIDRIVKGSKEYRNLRNMKKPLKFTLYSSLGVLSALIMLAAVWFGFRLARDLSAPIFALASGTQRIAKGDLSVRLASSSQDEFGMLIHSFNRMAADLENSRHETMGAYSLLEEQNRQTARYSEYIETVLNNIAAGVVSFDPDGYINTVNHAACDIFGLEIIQLVGRRIEDILPAAQGITARHVRERFQNNLESRTQHSVSVNIHGEERRLLVNVVGFATGGIYQGAVAVFEDVSELERMQRMAAWREVARRIAHEIKNPLTPIKLSAQRLARKFGRQVDDPVFTQSTELIVKQVEYLQAMVQEFSAFAKLPEVTPVPGDLAPLLQGITNLFRNSHINIRWNLDLAPNLPELPMDSEALHRAFMNLLSNSAEALANTNQPDPSVWIQATVQPNLNLVRIDVADNGPGLTEEERSRLFEPYFSRKKGGTGLGLTIVRSIVSDHRGYIRAFPREGGGTVISMELPLS